MTKQDLNKSTFDEFFGELHGPLQSTKTPLHCLWSFKLFCLAIGTIPLQGFYLGGVVTTPLKLVFLATLAVFALEVFLNRVVPLPMSSPLWLLATYVVWAASSIIWADHKEPGLMFGVSVASLGIFYYMTALYARSPICVRSIWRWAFLGIVLSGIIAHFQFAGYIPIPGKPEDMAAVYGARLRAPGGTEGANVLALYLSAIIIAAYVRAIYQRFPVLTLAVLSYLVYLLMITYTRAGYIGCAIGVLVGSLMSRNRRAALAFSFIGITAFLLSTEFVFARVMTLSDIQSDYSASQRLVFADAALRMFSDNPFGVGVGNFIPNSLPYIGGSENNPRAAHNAFLTVLAELGLPGILLYLAFISMHFVYAKKLLAVKAPIAVACLSVMTGLLTQYPFHGYMYDKMLFILMGVVYGSYLTSFRATDPLPRPHSPQ